MMLQIKSPLARVKKGENLEDSLGVHPDVANLLGSVSILLTTGIREQDAHTTDLEKWDAPILSSPFLRGIEGDLPSVALFYEIGIRLREPKDY